MIQTLNDLHLPYIETSLTFTYFTQKLYTVLKVFSVTTDRVIETKTLKWIKNNKPNYICTQTLSPSLHKKLSTYFTL